MRAVFVAVALIAFACGGHPQVPVRGVVETDLGAWKFRRFQGLLDVEVWVEGNRAQAYSASYITADAEQRGHIADSDLVNVFVTRYERPDGVVRATVKFARRLAQEGYQVEEDKIAGARALTINGHGEAWVMWPSQLHVVKVGGRGRRDVPPQMVANYVDRYPSQLPGGALEGALPPGPDEAPRKPEQPGYDAANPRPDIEHYDPNKVKLPEPAPDTSTPSPASSTTTAGAANPTSASGTDAATTAKPADATKTKPTKAKRRRKPAPKQ